MIGDSLKLEEEEAIKRKERWERKKIQLSRFLQESDAMKTIFEFESFRVLEFQKTLLTESQTNLTGLIGFCLETAEKEDVGEDS